MRGYLPGINWWFNPILIQSGPTHNIVNQSLRNAVLIFQGYPGFSVLAVGPEHAAMRRMARGMNDVGTCFWQPGLQIFQIYWAPYAGQFLVAPGAELTIVHIHIGIVPHKVPALVKPGFGIFNEPLPWLKMVNYVNGPWTIWSAI